MFDYRSVKKRYGKAKKSKLKLNFGQLQKSPFSWASGMVFDLLKLGQRTFIDCWLGLFEKIAKNADFSRPWNIPERPRKISFTLCGMAVSLVVAGLYEVIMGQAGTSIALFFGALFASILASWVLRRIPRA
jgi:hypothetical protein